MMQHFAYLTFPLIFILAFGTVVAGQDLDDSVIFGSVTDTSGAVVPGAVVTVAPVNNGPGRSARTDRFGRFRIIELAPGQYRIETSFEGFAATRRSVEIVSGQTARIDLLLAPASVNEQVAVDTNETPVLDTTRTVVGSSMSGDEVREFPNSSGDVLDLIYLFPGTDEEPFSIDDLADDDRIGSGSERDRPAEVLGAGSIALSGGAAYSTNITIDGLDNNDDRSAEERFQPPPDSVAELQVVTNQFSAEYGRASGGRINIRTRAGSGVYRGRLVGSFEDESLNANTYNNNRRGLGRLPYTKVDPGFTFQGPVPFTGARTFFHASYLQQRRLAASLIDTMMPVDTNPRFPLPPPTHPEDRRVDDIPNPQTDTFPAVDIAPYRKTVSTPGIRQRFTGRFDHAFGDSHSLTVSYQFGRSEDLRQYRETTRYLEETLQSRRRSTDAISVSNNLVLGSRGVNQFRFQYSGFRPSFAAKGAEDPVVLIFISDDSLAGSDDQVRGTVVVGNSTANFASLRKERRMQFQDSLSLLAGRHTFRAGIDVQTIRSDNTDLADSTGTFNFSRVYDLLANQPSRYRRNFGSTSVQENTYTGLFIQDEFNVRPGLTITLGLRYERESIIGDSNNIGPRVALAWSPSDDGRTVFRLGAGVFYNRVLLRTLDDYSLGEQAVRFDSESLDGPSNEARCLNRVAPGPDATSDKCRFLYALSNNFPDPPDQEQLAAILSGLGISGGGFVNETNFSRFVEDGIAVPESYQFNAGFERDIGSGFVVEANFTFNKASRLWRETNVNAFRPPEGFTSLTEYLLSLGTFEMDGTATRFYLGDPGDTAGVSTEAGIRSVNLASSNGSEARGAPIGIAFRALETYLVRPYDPTLGQVEMVSSIGRSVYEGLTVTLSRRNSPLLFGFTGSFRSALTISRTRDDGFVDTSSAQTAGDFRSEFAPSGIDRRFKFRFSGIFTAPGVLGGITFAPVLRLETARPFNLGIGGSDRNLDDVGNDRPSFSGAKGGIVYRRPNDPFPAGLAASFSLPPIGSPGDLPRNAGRGPGLFAFDAAFSREFSFGKRIKVRPQVTVTNLLNAKVYSFGSDYINLSESGTAEFQRGFLVPGRTLRQRRISLGVRIDL